MRGENSTYGCKWCLPDALDVGRTVQRSSGIGRFAKFSAGTAPRLFRPGRLLRFGLVGIGLVWPERNWVISARFCPPSSAYERPHRKTKNRHFPGSSATLFYAGTLSMAKGNPPLLLNNDRKNAENLFRASSGVRIPRRQVLAAASMARRTAKSTRRGQVHVFGQRFLVNFIRSRPKMDRTPDFAVLRL